MGALQGIRVLEPGQLAAGPFCGQPVDGTIHESVLAVTESRVGERDRGGHVRERHGSSLPGIAPSNTADVLGDRLGTSPERLDGLRARGVL